jgi:FKBP-type peptidyl-prolyl cis-trans isomerase
MNTTQVTATGIAVALAVVIALGLLFFGPRLFSPFAPSTAQTATSTDSLTQTASSTTPMASSPQSSQPIPNPLPTTLTGSDEVVGTGAEAVAGKSVTVNYVGMLPDGTVFDASAQHGQAFTFTLGAGQVIKGWDLGVAGMKEGGKRRLIIPADLAYGNQAVGGVIPANATLIFDIELVKVQ